MEMNFKKECKHSVVHESDDDSAPTSSVYVSKLWLARNGVVGNEFPASIKLEVTIPA